MRNVRRYLSKAVAPAARAAVAMAAEIFIVELISLQLRMMG